MNTEVEKPKPAPPTVACTVLVTGTTVGDVICRKGAKIRLPKADAEALAGLTPPRVEIIGIHAAHA